MFLDPTSHPSPQIARPDVETIEQLVREFLPFCRAKPAGETYDFWSIDDSDGGCAIIQFVRARFPETYPWRAFVYDKMHTGPVGKAVLAAPHTFGALAQRLAAR